jgi:hypothetical protein
MTPTIHLGGTSRDFLVNAVLEARAKLGEALKAMEKVAPNGRDYYPQGPDAVRVATNEHYLRVSKINMVMEELESLAEAISDAPGSQKV